GNLRRAEELFNESRQIRETVFPARSIHRIHPIVGLGSLSLRKGEYEKTYSLFNQALSLMNRATTTHYDYDNLNRIFLGDLTELCLALERRPEAAEYLEKLSIASAGVAKFSSRIGRRLQTALILELKARYHLLNNDFKKARYYLNKANEYNSGIKLTEATFKILRTKAILEWRLGNAADANQNFIELVRSYRKHIETNFSGMSDYEKEQFYRTLKTDFNFFNAYLLDIHASKPTALFEEAYDHLINTKALLLNVSNRGKNEVMASGDTAMIHMFQKYEYLKSNLTSLYFDGGRESEIRDVEILINDLEKQINLRSNSNSFNQSKTWQQVRAALWAGEAAVEIIRVNKLDRQNPFNTRGGMSDSVQYVALIVRQDSGFPEYVVLPNGRRLEGKSLSYYRNAIVTQLRDDVSYNEYWTPLKTRLAGITRIYLSGDGVYSQINLNTLRDPVTDQYFIDEVDLVYLTNTADLLRKKLAGSSIKTASLFGRPDFQASDTGEPVSNRLDGMRDLNAGELLELKKESIADLPGTEMEITSIRTTLQNHHWAVTSYSGVTATESNVKNVRAPTVLHIATHGFFVEDTLNIINPMIRSGVIMAGVKAVEKTSDDGILTAYEATNLDLTQTELVVLSACETGLGEVKNGEGVYGLQRAIIVAGASNLLMSLWKVDDAATAQLMITLYNDLAVKGSRTAFRDAQLSLRKEYPHPFFWGAFVMLGN
ncbi:MAG TPA: CHAT domain-containing protein, partial [Chryseosolibacter sp.]|nr:CHAT domain-containing protein [Chryseosolibacter sp.]